MINTLRIYNELKEAIDPVAAEKIADVLGLIYDELRDTVTKTEFNELKDIVAELAQAQKRTEQRVEELAAGLVRLERNVESLVGEMKVFKQELGGLAHTVGYRLEDEAMKSLPALLNKDHAVTVEGPLIRDFLEIGPKKYVELNIWGYGLQHGERVAIIGEAKSQLKKRDVENFLQTLKALQPYIHNRIIPVLITYQTSPQVRQHAHAKGIHLYFSYQL